jgi:serine protease Do
MRKLSLFILISISLNCFSQVGILGNSTDASIRIDKLKKSTVKILINNIKSGTGFFVSKDGEIVTNFHVVFTENTRTKKSLFGSQVTSKIQAVTYQNDTLDLDVKSILMFKNKINELRARDYLVLKIINKYTVTNYLDLGSSKDVPEGTTVYTCGFPFDMNDPFVSTGILSTKSTEDVTIDNTKISIDKLWIDVTINKGNSGGALVALGNKPEDDKVIGITSFIITPYLKELNGLNEYIKKVENSGSVTIMGINFLEYAHIINTTINSNSVGISGAMSIDEIKRSLK